MIILGKYISDEGAKELPIYKEAYQAGYEAAKKEIEEKKKKAKTTRKDGKSN